jgi:hypothetical protein
MPMSAGGTGPWLAVGVPFLPDIHYLIIWQHIARDRSGTDDAAELKDNLRLLAGAFYGKDMLTGAVSLENQKASRANWPGPVIDFLLGELSPVGLRNLAGSAEDAIIKRRRLCDVDFYTGLARLKAAPVDARLLLKSAADNCPPGALERSAAKAESERLKP